MTANAALESNTLDRNDADDFVARLMRPATVAVRSSWIDEAFPASLSFADAQAEPSDSHAYLRAALGLAVGVVVGVVRSLAIVALSLALTAGLVLAAAKVADPLSAAMADRFLAHPDYALALLGRHAATVGELLGHPEAWLPRLSDLPFVR